MLVAEVTTEDLEVVEGERAAVPDREVEPDDTDEDGDDPLDHHESVPPEWCRRIYAIARGTDQGYGLVSTTAFGSCRPGPTL